MSVETRPFAIEPLTHVMLPDGIFDNAIYNLDISCHYTNTSGSDLTNVTLYLESVGDPGIAVTGQTFTFDTIPADASVLVAWSANFQFAVPGKPLASFVAQADGFTSSRSIQQIFVTQTRFDDMAQKWTCSIPEGRLEITDLSGIRPGIEWWPEGGGCKCPPYPPKPPYPGPNVPTGIKMAWYPNPAFTGQFGDLPYSDPWWKIIAIIVAVIAAIVGAIAAAAGAGTFSPGVKGTFNEDPSAPSVQCCTPNPGGSVSNDATTVAGVCGVICSVAIAVACSDAADPIYRGEQNTMPAEGELTVAETVDAHWTFVDPPNAGVPYTTKVKWRYERRTTGASYSYDVEEEQTNIHVVKNVEVDTPAVVQHQEGWLWARAKFEKPDGTLYIGPDLYTFCFFRSPEPGGLYFLEPLLDDGRARDVQADDGIFTGALNLEVAQRYLAKQGASLEGLWRVYVYAQEVNRTAPGTAPVIAAQTVGGNFIASAVSIKFDPSLPCPFTAQATIEVV
jgi:hypothetical protein